MAPKKGQASKTRPGELDFVTHKGDKDFDRGGHREQTPESGGGVVKPYQEASKKGGMRKLSEKEKDWVRKVVQEKGLDKKQSASLRMKVMRSKAELKSKKAVEKLVMG